MLGEAVDPRRGFPQHEPLRCGAHLGQGVVELAAGDTGGRASAEVFDFVGFHMEFQRKYRAPARPRLCF